jgi:hypothetical protein
VNHLAAGLFFTLALLGATMFLHMFVRRHAREVLLALRGEWQGVPHYRIVPARTSARLRLSPGLAPGLATPRRPERRAAA